MVSSTTPTPPTRAVSTGSGACTSGSTGRPEDATRAARGGVGETSTDGGSAGWRERDHGDLPLARGLGVLRELRPLLCLGGKLPVALLAGQLAGDGGERVGPDLDRDLRMGLEVVIP